jgi:chemotaxis family two-component system response regulator Rcp1
VFELLVIEDNAADVRLMKEALRLWTTPHCIHVADDGEEATHFLWSRGKHAGAPRPDLVLLDINLPKRNGFEVLWDMKMDRHLREIPVVVFSSSTSQTDIRRAYECYANCYISKPRDLEDLFKIFHELETFWFRSATLPRDVIEKESIEDGCEGSD